MPGLSSLRSRAARATLCSHSGLAHVRPSSGWLHSPSALEHWAKVARGRGTALCYRIYIGFPPPTPLRGETSTGMGPRTPHGLATRTRCASAGRARLQLRGPATRPARGCCGQVAL